MLASNFLKYVKINILNIKLKKKFPKIKEIKIQIK